MRKCGETGRTEMTILSRIACWIPKATNTGSEYILIIIISSALQQWLREGASVLGYTSVTCLVIQTNIKIHR